MQILDNIFQTEVYNWITAIFIISSATPNISVANFFYILKMNFSIWDSNAKGEVFKENVKIRYFDGIFANSFPETKEKPFRILFPILFFSGTYQKFILLYIFYKE